ncbi:MAG: hypothetical protein R3A10_08090 [Caldilineaceae bacterium]
MAGIKIEGIQEAERGMLKAIAAVKPGTGLGAAVKAGTFEAHRYAKSITHVDTGALKASHYMRIRGEKGEIFINPSASRSDGRSPAEYGPYEHARGGSHAFYARVPREHAREIGGAAAAALRRYLP